MKGRKEGIANRNQEILRGLPLCRRVLGGRAHFNAFPPILAFINKLSLMNPSLNTTYAGGV